MNTLHVEDFVVLGRTVPEESKKYGQRICMAGYSPDNGQFLRVYPLMVPVGDSADANGFRARHTYALDLQRNLHDTRSESWRVKDQNAPTSTPWSRAVEVSKTDILRRLLSRKVPSIAALNDCKLSLGVLVVNAGQWQGEMVKRDAQEPPEFHQGLFDDLADQSEPQSDLTLVKHAPYIRFEDRDGPHRLQVREWGAYRLLADPKYADTPESLWTASGYHLDADLMLVVGNMNNHRNNWLVIKTFELARGRSATPSLFDELSEEESA